MRGSDVEIDARRVIAAALRLSEQIGDVGSLLVGQTAAGKEARVAIKRQIE
jgi:hypothetical protein